MGTLSERAMERHRKLCESMLATLESKRNDYANATDPFWNLRLSEITGVAGTDVAIFSRLLDKIGRIANGVKGKTYDVSESLLDSIADAIGYLLILDAYIVLREEDNAAKRNAYDAGWHAAHKGKADG